MRINEDTIASLSELHGAATLRAERDQAVKDALRKAADALEAQPAKIQSNYVSTLRLYADEPWRLA